MAAKKAKPTEVTLRFPSEYAKDYFLGQLSDGWGENVVHLDWDGRRNMKDCPIIDVVPLSDWGDETHEIVDEASDRQRQRMKECFGAALESEPSGSAGDR